MLAPELASRPQAAPSPATAARRPSIYWRAEDCRVEDFAALVETRTTREDYPGCVEIAGNIPVYEGASIRRAAGDPAGRQAIASEIADALAQGPGVIAVRGAWPDLENLDRVSEAFRAIIDEEVRNGTARGDHFAKPGANSRIWNALQKLCLADPAAYAGYYANEILDLVAACWLGPGYRLTSQVNVVNPGGAAQVGHRDYHLGFMSPEQLARYPAQVQRLSPCMSLQAAVAHVDMPLESGPTLFLPHSQKYDRGYLAVARPDFQDYFNAHRVQVPLGKGDAVFFNPAMMHAAGTNHSASIYRMANLMLISSPMGVAMESVDSERMCREVYPALQALKGELSQEQRDVVVSVTADGYAFPTNLDRDPPVDGLAPATQQDLLRKALGEAWPIERLAAELRALAVRRQP